MFFIMQKKGNFGKQLLQHEEMGLVSCLMEGNCHPPTETKIVSDSLNIHDFFFLFEYTYLSKC